jgi:meiotic recombination protein DMC1
VACVVKPSDPFAPSLQGGGNGRTLYLDSENGFAPERLLQIADRFQLEHEFVMENVKHAPIYNEEMYEETLKLAKQLISEEEVRLVIFDSIMAVFRFEYNGRGELSERQQKLGKLVYSIKKMATEYNVAVVFTNQMTADPGSVLSNDAKKPVGGHVLAHLVDTRVYLRKGRGDQRIARIEDSPRLPMAEATFSISTGGIIDPTD